MLTLGPGSVCDICLDEFSTGSKASAIICGHVFCSECIDKLRSAPPTSDHPHTNYKPCPICRHTFDTRTYIRLHVDYDNNPPPAISMAAGPTASREDAHTVQYLLERIISIFNEGCSEEEARQCIVEIKIFLRQQKDVKQFIELRACYKMLVYITDVRVASRQLKAHNTDLERSLDRLRLEKTSMERVNKEKIVMASFVEKCLWDHANETRDEYLAMIQHYNRLVTEFKTFRERLTPDGSYSRYDQAERELDSRMAQEYPAYRDEHFAAEIANSIVSPLLCIDASHNLSCSLSS